MGLGTYRARMAFLRWAGPRSGPLARWVRFPNPWAAPWRRPVLDIVAHGGIGDVIMCTPALRELKRRNPRALLRFYSKFSVLVQDLPYVDQALPYDARPPGAVYMDYSDESDFIAPRAPLVALLGDTLGLALADTRVDCVIDPTLVARFRTAWLNLPRPHIAVVRRASSQRTSNKNWPDESWRALLARLGPRAGVIELGEAQVTTDAPMPGTYVDLRGRTSVAELVAAIAAAASKTRLIFWSNPGLLPEDYASAGVDSGVNQRAHDGQRRGNDERHTPARRFNHVRHELAG